MCGSCAQRSAAREIVIMAHAAKLWLCCLAPLVMATPLLKATPPLVSVDGEAIKLTWRQIIPMPNDFITVSCGTAASLDDYLEDSLGGKLIVNASLGYVRTKPLINMRCDYTIRYVRGGAAAELSQGKRSVGSSNLKLIAQVRVPLKAGLAQQPTQGHVAFGDTDDAMWVMWTSASRTPSIVRWGLQPGHLDRTVTSPTPAGTYLNTDMCHAPANLTGQQNWIDPGWLHRVLLTGLPADAAIHYSFGSATEGMSPERHFRSKQPAGGPRETRFCAWGDQDWDDPPPASATTAANCLSDALERGYGDFVLHYGDLAYAMGTGTDWEMWSRQNAPLATRVPYMVSVGNHEMCYANHGGANDPSCLEKDRSKCPNGYHPKWGA